MNFSTPELARRITEFQVAEGEEGKLLGAVGLQMAERQGRIHSEAFTDFALADSLRPLLWERLQQVAANHGLVRLWTQETAPFWSHCGLRQAEGDAAGRLPAAWKALAGIWLTLKLKEDIEEILSADKEFALFMESERERTRRSLQQAKLLKVFATLIAFGLLALVIAGALYVLRHNPRFGR